MINQAVIEVGIRREGTGLENLTPTVLEELLTELDNEQALYDERAYAALRFARMCEEHVREIEQKKMELSCLLSRLVEVEQLFRQRS